MPSSRRSRVAALASTCALLAAVHGLGDAVAAEQVDSGLEPGFAVVTPNSRAGADVRAGRSLSQPVLLHMAHLETNAEQGHTGISQVNVRCSAVGDFVRSATGGRRGSVIWYRLLAAFDDRTGWVPAAQVRFQGDLRPPSCQRFAPPS